MTANVEETMNARMMSRKSLMRGLWMMKTEASTISDTVMQDIPANSVSLPHPESMPRVASAKTVLSLKARMIMNRTEIAVLMATTADTLPEKKTSLISCERHTASMK